MTTDLATRNGASLIERVIIGGDLSALTPEERIAYYRQVCESVGLNPLTKPFEYLTLDGKLILYARRDCTDQLRDIKGVSIVKLEKERMEDLYVVTAYATRPDGRQDSSVGAVALVKENGAWATNPNGRRYFKTDGSFSALTGDALANAIMKCETKAKRRVTLSICGLGITDESELETIPGARTVTPDGEVIDSAPRAAEIAPVIVEQPQAQATVAAIQAAKSNAEGTGPLIHEAGPLIHEADPLWRAYRDLAEEAGRFRLAVPNVKPPIRQSELVRHGKAMRDAVNTRKAELAAQQTAIFGSDADGTAFADLPASLPKGQDARPLGEALPPSPEPAGKPKGKAKPVAMIEHPDEPRYQRYMELMEEARALDVSVEVYALNPPVEASKVEATIVALEQDIIRVESAESEAAQPAAVA